MGKKIDFITGDGFKSVGKWTYAPTARDRDDYDTLKNVFRIKNLADGDVIYTHTFYVKQLFKIIEEVPQEVIVVTHNSDMNIDESFSLPDNVIRWFSQNVNVVHERIESIPIGLENDRWFPQLKKKEKMRAAMGLSRNFKNLAYMNHNVGTNPAKRSQPFELLKDKPWVTTEMGKNGADFDDYLLAVFTHRFVICPEGNGMDTHRTWESLYMGAIPVELKNNNNRFYEDLPILLIDDWEELTEEFLKDKYNQMMGGSRSWNYDKLKMSYWKNLILSTK